MASPETDSGFVGSETSRVSPLTQTPEHRLSHSRYPRTAPGPQGHAAGTAWDAGAQDGPALGAGLVPQACFPPRLFFVAIDC